MGMKEELGKKIRSIRESMGLSRETVCDDESELTVRQLARIESGESLPTLVKLKYICEKLGVKISDIVDESDIEIPKEYEFHKVSILKFKTYFDDKRLIKKDELFDEIYSQYYNRLPEEEQIAVDILQAAHDIYSTKNPLFGDSIIQEYFEQVKVKEVYKLNDLLLIRLYFFQITEDSSRYNPALFKHFIKTSLNSINLQDVVILEYAIDFYITALTVLLLCNDFEFMPTLFNITNQLLDNSRDTVSKIIVMMLEAKYMILHLKDYDLGKEKYEKAIMGAKFIDDENLEFKILSEYRKDFNK